MSILNILQLPWYTLIGVTEVFKKNSMSFIKPFNKLFEYKKLKSLIYVLQDENIRPTFLLLPMVKKGGGHFGLIVHSIKTGQYF